MARKKQSPPKTSQTSPRSQAVENTIGSIDKLPTSLMLRVFGLFLMLSFLIYGVSLDFGFVLDDKIVLSENSFTKKGLEGISDLFAYDTFQGYFGEQKNILQGGRYRPLSLVSFALEYQLFGLNPMIFHLGNILIYALSVFVSFITLRRLFKEQKLTGTGLLGSTAFVAALIFLIHPIHTEAVANIKGRDEIMAFLFSMLTLFLCTKFYDTRKSQNLIFASLSFLLGLFSKENTITFLAVVPFTILLFRPVIKSRLIIILSNLVICTIIYLAVRINALGYLMIDNPSTDIMNNPFVNLDTLEKYGTIAYTLLVYLKLNFIPLKLTHDYYPFHVPIMGLGDWQVWLSVVLHLGLAAAVFYFWKKKPVISFALGFYIATLSIVSNIIITVGTFMNERFAFMASLGMCILMALAFQKLREKKKEGLPPKLLMTLFSIFILAYSYKSFDRVFAWENELTLNQAAIKVSKNSARANSFTATAYFNKYKEITDQNERQELLSLARPYAERAIEILPDYLNANLMMTGILAEEYKFDRDLNKLLLGFKDVASRRPDVEYLTTYLKYLNDSSSSKEDLVNFYLDLGYRILYQEQKKYNWAIHYLLLADQKDPNNPRVYTALYQSYMAIGRSDLAERYNTLPVPKAGQQ